MSAYDHQQTAAASTWNIAHNLGKQFVNIDVIIDYQGVPTGILPQNITVTDANNAVVTFSSAHTGVARVSV